jgi:protein-S-isoprenylcysteine O-methyltransferase Ste14
VPSHAPTIISVSIYCWYVFEIVLVVRDVVRGKGRLTRDRGTRTVAAVAVVGSVVAAGLLHAHVPALDTPAPLVFAVLGSVVLWCGLMLRAWAVVTLGSSFRTSVEVDAGQPVVTRGPYARIRHPSYTGLLLIALGAGIGLGNWLSLALCAVVPPLGILPRVAVEEAEMTRVLGDEYRRYQARTRRLVPGLW